LQHYRLARDVELAVNLTGGRQHPSHTLSDK
jgi:hypothetical protein